MFTSPPPAPRRAAPPGLLLFFLLLALQACGAPLPPQEITPADTTVFPFRPESPPTYATDGLRIATLNTEFMFDGAGDEGQASFPHKGDPLEARRHRSKIGAVIRMLDADIVMLQEVENLEVMQQLIEEELSGLDYQAYFVQGTDTFTGQDVGLLSRVPVEQTGRSDQRVPVGATDDTYGVSKNLYARLNLGGLPTTLIGLHLLARPDDPSRRDRRQAQAEVIRRLAAQEIAAGRAVAVLGDFNDFDEATPDLSASRPITDVLARIKSAGPGARDDLRNVLADVPRWERFTAFYDRNENSQVEPGELSALDHILLSPRLYERLREVTYVQAYDPATYTDHFPIVVTLGL